MAITTLDGIIAGAQPLDFFYKALTGTLVGGRPHSTFYQAGIPGAAVAPTPGIAGANLTSYAGQIPFSNPVSGNTYLARFSGQSSAQQGTLLLCDRLWHNSGMAVTGTNTINSAVFPARDANGTTNGEGVLIGLEVSAATGATAPTAVALNYTNSAGTAGRVGANLVSMVASSIAGTFHPLGLQAGDIGVRTVESIVITGTWTSGTIHAVAYRIIAALPVNQAGLSIDAITSGMPRLYDNSVPFLIFVPNTTTTTTLSAGITFTQG